MKFDTKVVRSGISPDPSTGAIVPPIYQSATYVLEEVGKDKGYDYTRASNPTREMLENNLAELEGGKHAICFSSGMAAVDSVMKILKSGDHVVCSDDVYGGVSRLYNKLMVNYNINFTYVNSSNPQEVEDAIQDNTRLIWIETPTNPLLKITDLDAVGKIAKKHGIIYGVDSTFSTPALLRPLEFGADIVQHSTTKYLSGHNQIIGGVLITNDNNVGDIVPGGVLFLTGSAIDPEGEDFYLRWALAEAMETLGNIRTKHDSYPTVGGDRGMNGDALLAEARERKEKLDLQVLDRIRSTPIVIG